MIDGTAELSLDSDEVVFDFGFEGRFPRIKARCLMIENVVISLIPYSPRTNREDFDEERLIKLLPSNVNLVMYI